MLRAGAHVDFAAANDLVGERRRGFVGRAACFCFGAYLAVFAVLLLAATMLGGGSAIAWAIHFIGIHTASLIRGQ